MFKNEEKEKELVSVIADRFLKPGLKFETIKEILEAPLTALKKVNEKSSKLLSEAAFIDTIGGLVDLDPTNPFYSMLQGKGVVEDPIRFSMLKENIKNRLEGEISHDLMRDIIVAAKLISRSEKKAQFYLKEKKEQKILFLGLDNAGKTAILNVLSGKINPSFLSKLKPTKRVDREKLVTKDFEIHVWDMGGQKDYRENYLAKENLEMFFLQTDMVVYVIDMQDMERIPESIEYLKSILDTLKYLGEDPFLLCFLHKSDPDIISDPRFQINLETVKDGLLALLNNYDLDYDAYPTSIYYLYSRQAKFTGFIKQTLDDQKTTAEKKKDPVKVMGEVLDTAMNLTVNLANTMEQEFQKVNATLFQLQSRLQGIEVALQHKFPDLEISPSTAKQIPTSAPLTQAQATSAQEPSAFGPLPPPPPQMEAAPMISQHKKPEGEHNVRMTMMDELKKIFAKRNAGES